MRKTFAQGCASLLLGPVLAAMLVGTVALAADSSGGAAGSKSSAASTPPKITVDIEAEESGSLPVGKTRQLTATVTVDDVEEKNPSIAWKSEEKTVATVSGGTVTAVGVGETTITATYTHSGSKTEESATYRVKVVSASVTELKLEIDGESPKTTSVGGMCTVAVNVTPTWSTNKTGLTEGERKRLEWSAKIIDGSQYISLPYAKGTGIPKVRVDGVKPTTASEKGKIEIEVTYKNVGGGVDPASEKIKCEIEVTSNAQVIITEYSVQTREVTLIKGGSAKVLQAYRTEDNQWAGTDDITWEDPSESGIVEITKNGNRVTVTPKAVGEVTLTAVYNDGTANPPKSTVTCIVKENTSGGTNPGGETPVNPSDGDELPDGVTAQVTIEAPTAGTGSTHVTDPGTEDIRLSVTFRKGSGPASEGTFEWSSKKAGYAVYLDTDDGNKRYVVPITWKSSNEKAVKVNTVVSGNTGKYVLVSEQAGEAALKVSVGGASAELKVTVRGFELVKSKITLIENKTHSLTEGTDPILKVRGSADLSTLSVWPDNATVAGYVNGKVVAYSPGKTTFTVSDPKRGFRASFEVEVEADPYATIDYGTLYTQTQKVLHFSDLLSDFRRQAGGSLSHITGLNVDASKGTLYYRYNESNGSGTGVGSGSYYHPYRKGGVPTSQWSIEDVTFVPKPGFAGKVTIYYTGVSEGDGSGISGNYICKLEINVDPGSGSKAGIFLTTSYNTALRLSGSDFSRVCREQLGVSLGAVTFSQPPERQGTLYTNYVSAGNYGREVAPGTRYSMKELDDIWFVPAPGFSGTVTVYYTAYGAGTDAGSYAGQASITVNPEGGVAIGGLTFDTARGGVARFDDERFNSYCREVLHEDSRSARQTLSYIRFDALPSAGEGVLYYDYRSSGTGIRAEIGTSYYYGTRNPRIDRLTFVPAASFIGTVKIPFTGWTSDGTRFTGNVEVNVRGGSGYGDIWYVCAPGQSVSFRSSDFTSLCRDLTGRTISNIVFRGLPSTSDGSLYYNNTRISTTGTQYQNSNIGRLSFRASNSFSGVVDIPFEGRSTGGEVFSGVVTVSTSSSGSSISWGNIKYAASASRAAVFDWYDFDDLSRWETGRGISSVRFQVPSVSQGDLYRNYRSGSDRGTRISSSGTSVSRGGLDQVAFVPAKNYSGTVYIDFTATSDNGDLFDGTVEIAVERETVNVPASVKFSDVAAGAYYADAVKWAVDNGITSGTSATTFSPNQTCTVAQILSFLYRANGSPRVTGSNPFTDVRTSDYYYEAALWAYQKGLVSGSAFNPFSPCTRSMVVTYLWKLAGQPSPAAQPLGYAPYTLSGSQEYGNFTVRFDAAVTAKTRITLHHDNDLIDYIVRDFEPSETYDVTLIAVRPGSSYTIDGGFYGFSYASDGAQWFNGVPGRLFFRASDGSFRYTVTQTGHDDSEFALFRNSLSWFRENGRQESITGNNGSTDCGALIRLNGSYYFVTYADSAIAAGLLSGSTGFSDVSPNASYAQAVAWASERKITSGTSKTTFSPDKTCTRGQIVTFLYRAMGW